MLEWLPSLQLRSKWWKTQKNIVAGNVVLVVLADNLHRKWPLGCITQVFPGPDGETRAVELEKDGKLYSQPIVKVCPLEIG